MLILFVQCNEWILYSELRPQPKPVKSQVQKIQQVKGQMKVIAKAVQFHEYDFSTAILIRLEEDTLYSINVHSISHNKVSGPT